MHEGRRRRIGVGGFEYREGYWEEAHNGVHDRDRKIRASLVI